MVSPFRYAEPVSLLLQQLKYDHRLRIVPALAETLAEQVLRQAEPLPEALIAVPLHSSRMRRRGFNQAALLARETGRLLDIPVVSGLLQRVRPTPSQTSLDATARAKNLRDAFAVGAPGRYDAIAVIDDVITSGATMGAACRALRRQGYSRIGAWAIATT
jgi:ComF family protein